MFRYFNLNVILFALGKHMCIIAKLVFHLLFGQSLLYIFILINVLSLTCWHPSKSPMFHFHAIQKNLVLVIAITAVLPFWGIALLEEPAIVDGAAEIFAQDGSHVLYEDIWLRSIMVHVGVIALAFSVQCLRMLRRPNGLTVLVGLFPELVLLKNSLGFALFFFLPELFVLLRHFLFNF